MLDLKIILNDAEKIKQVLINRGWEKNKANSIIEKIFFLGKNRSTLMFQQQNLQNELNTNSALIGQYKSQKKNTEELMKQINLLKEKLQKISIETEKNNQELEDLLLEIPNIPTIDTPVGFSEEDNVVIENFWELEQPIIPNPLTHYEIGINLDILDFKRAVKMSGTRFAIFKNQGAQLVRALASFMLDFHTKKGYKELTVPTMVKTEMLYGTGQLPKFGQDSYRIENQDMWMIATSEIPVTNYYNNEIVDLSIPQKFTAYTRCYRSEAGSGGKDTKGLIRSHEFHKVELVKIVSQEESYAEYLKTVEDAKDILKALKIPFQAVQLCTGDLGFSSQKTIDLELWLPSENKYRETSSVSIFGDFQARRAKIRYRDAQGKTKYAHTINGSGLAIDRVIAALLEIYQNQDGTITIPSVLVPYMGGKTKIEKNN
ncbi:serine--tRNA ligase [Mycoplasma iguanae]|uniref:Serine--tRNA ligase n=1 Tax=Mycoplasma iguanae TaxID=292461 RepID=A0ABY5R916_9MOLU|nr:serine--tRNA ligase [Mycoplasma iguanae]UVD81662.1 serine--tRNA ligase [Mycoplasma iguanae]